MRMGDAAKEVVNLAEEIGVSLVAVGCRCRGGIRRALMGSVSYSVARHTHCPVLVVRDSGERMPKDHERRFSYYDPSGYRRVG